MDEELFEFAKDNDLSFEETGRFRILPTKKILI
jgi:hypothetical protein